MDFEADVALWFECELLFYHLNSDSWLCSVVLAFRFSKLNGQHMLPLSLWCLPWSLSTSAHGLVACAHTQSRFSAGDWHVIMVNSTVFRNFFKGGKVKISRNKEGGRLAGLEWHKPWWPSKGGGGGQEYHKGRQIPPSAPLPPPLPQMPTWLSWFLSEYKNSMLLTQFISSFFKCIFNLYLVVSLTPITSRSGLWPDAGRWSRAPAPLVQAPMRCTRQRHTMLYVCIY